MPSGKKRSLRQRLIRISLLVLLSVLAAVVILVESVRSGFFGRLPTTTELAALRNEEATLVLAENGALIGKIFAKDRTNILYKDLPDQLVNALVATEDQRFFEHQGVDAWSYLRVLFRSIMLRDESGGGGSTISQQIIKNLYGRERHGLLTMPVNKIKEAIVARRLESVYDKEDVLTLYFNSVPFGEDLYGVEAAAQRFFGKGASRLRVEEAAVLVGMLKANTVYNPRTHPERSRGRRDQVLTLMSERGNISAAARDSLSKLPIKLNYRGLDALDAYGYFTAEVAREARTILTDLARKGKNYDIEKDGLRIHTTLDTALQRSALASARKQLSAMQPKLDRELRASHARKTWEKEAKSMYGKPWKLNERAPRDVFRWNAGAIDTMSYRDSLWHYQSMLHAAVLMMEPETGKVRAWVGGNDHRALPFDLVASHRPIASTIKPIIYAAAIENGAGPCDYLSNAERSYPEFEGWTPHNFDGSSGGECAAWYALAHSMNLPTVDLYFRTGADTLKKTFDALELPDKDLDKPALALGAADISLKEIVRAYCAFAARGQMPEPRLIERITDAEGKTIWKAPPSRTRPAMGAFTAATITNILQRAVDEGTGASIRSRFHIRSELAAKTGTSQDFGDAWFVAYTPGLVVGTWVGARDRSIHFNSNLGSGAQLALPIVGQVLSDVERSRDERRRYLLPFDWVTNYEVDLSCPPTRTGVDRILQDLFGGKGEKSGGHEEPGKTQRPPTTKPEKKGLWRKLFPKRH